MKLLDSARALWHGGTLLAAIKRPAHEEHNSMLQWIGGPFDPGAFNIADVNEHVASVRA